MDSNSSSNCIGRYFLIILIPFIFIIFIGANYFSILNMLNINSHTFYILIAIFFIFLLFIPHNAYIAQCKIKSQFDRTKNELEKSLENTSLTINNKTKSVLSVRDFLENYFRGIRNDNFAKVASSIFPMLGILGTFIAIAISMPDFTVNNSKELDFEISKLLSGVGTAFYASIFGIFLSLLWIFFERIGLSKIEKLTVSLEDIYSKYIWSKQELLKFKYDQKSIRDNELINALKETFNLDFIRSVNQEHLNSYEKIIETTKSGLEGIEKSLVLQSKNLQRIANELKSSYDSIESREALEKNIAEFNKSAKELHKLLMSFDTGLDGALKKVDAELSSSLRELEDIVVSIKNLKD